MATIYAKYVIIYAQVYGVVQWTGMSAVSHGKFFDS